VFGRRFQFRFAVLALDGEAHIADDHHA